MQTMAGDNNNETTAAATIAAATTTTKPKPTSTHKRKLPKNKKRFGNNQRLGGNKKKSTTYPIYSEAVNNNEGSVAAAATRLTKVSAKKTTKAELAKQLAYSNRDVNISNKKNIQLQQQLVDSKRQHANDLSVVEEKFTAKSEECNTLASLAQDRRREGNEALQMADNKVAAMREDVSNQLEEAASQVAAAQADARTTVRAERQFTSHTTSRMEVQHQKELQRQSLSHVLAMAAKDLHVIKAEQQSEEYRQEVEATHAELHQLKLKHQEVIDALKINFKESVRSQQAKHIDEIAVKKREIARLENDGMQLTDIMNDVVGKLEEQEKIAREATKSAEKSAKLAAQRLEDRNKYKEQWREMTDELAAKEVELADHAEIIKEYEAAMEDMTGEYEEAIHNMMPNMFEKKWVKNVGMYTSANNSYFNVMLFS